MVIIFRPVERPKHHGINGRGKLLTLWQPENIEKEKERASQSERGQG